MDQQETTQTNYSRVSNNGLEDITTYLINDLFNEQFDLKTFIGNITSYSVPMDIESRYENNIRTYIKIYIFIYFIIFIPSLFIGSWKFFITESLFNILLFFSIPKLKHSSLFQLKPTILSIIYVFITFILCLFTNKLFIWLLFTIAVSGSTLHSITRVHMEEVLLTSL
ncbi:hypothetical protein EHI8A_008700 [Entamoeba histolytica HM-1:IMSS-B]|uniref:PRA1 family protein n=6 Tax=Entamoeba histolytica TaxID=5759 RepID=C4M7J9_ENTH1|nr:hypothetical protein EHI_170430 [Entamoeba histolytica HM-1:IMSS]EMD48970.1 Hypothetical protein EHI5A_023810 [Entamoeba histolytica KU27]EMH77739.1 hypothetical protein EHI8A_008700 [Entamoeba histolytica HM-1:IMSS-B]EMS14559.1 hypothetical protein KM1_026650 [Entamoeba histolytica HM-3:IMSS]ENY64771.1 hypothetical protein EHI7A_011230 [Entamoeba histolytica HM-1:IMSS-A]GAT97518.1 hypothetical protein CL6EHI_170430 [Entamoeba histolytica]|eukprot:XP_651031.1 hypothetical protein EHI_170430 [Entamoeba histolytica HM-1:IMSS]